MKLIYTLFQFGILFTSLTCADTPNKSVIQKELFGWAGAPEDINKKPHEYFYAYLSHLLLFYRSNLYNSF